MESIVRNPTKRSAGRVSKHEQCVKGGVEVDQIEMLMEQAHGLFGETSIFEVFDLPNHQEVIQTLTEFFGPVDVARWNDILISWTS